MTTNPRQPPKGMWVIPMTITTSTSEKRFIEAEVRKSIETLGQGIDRLDVHVAGISGEWQGVKHVTNTKSKRWSREKQFAELQRDTTDAPVILYLHGGAY